MHSGLVNAVCLLFLRVYIIECFGFGTTFDIWHGNVEFLKGESKWMVM